ncbi:MAG: hypothetical protein ACO3RW_04900 [Burkholderiaceae bacterium]
MAGSGWSGLPVSGGGGGEGSDGRAGAGAGTGNGTGTGAGAESAASGARPSPSHITSTGASGDVGAAVCLSNQVGCHTTNAANPATCSTNANPNQTPSRLGSMR